MAKRNMKKKRVRDLLVSQRLMASMEKRVKSVRTTFEKNVKDILKRLDIPTNKEFSALFSKIESLEKRIDKLEGIRAKKRPTDKAKQNPREKTQTQ